MQLHIQVWRAFYSWKPHCPSQGDVSEIMLSTADLVRRSLQHLVAAYLTRKQIFTVSI